MFTKSTELPFSQEIVFDYHSNAGAIDRLIPPWERVKILKRNRSLAVGEEVLLQQTMGMLKLEWLACHTAFEPPRHFRDEQIKGPFRTWVHDHYVDAVSQHSCRLLDSIQYEIPFGVLGRLGTNWIEKKISSMFHYRHQTTLEDLQFAKHLRSLNSTGERLRIAVSGSSGMIGRRVCALAAVSGIEVVRILRSESPTIDPSIPSHEVVSFSNNKFSDPKILEGLDAVIHLGGHGIANQRWTRSIKTKILASRVDSTANLITGLKSLGIPPKKFVCASGIGAYGDQGDEICSDASLIDDSIRGDSFLESVSGSWESAAREFGDVGTVCIGRLAMALHPLDGALSKMIPLFRCGLGGQLGDGKQYWSWIHVDDAAGAFLHMALNKDSSGIYNLCTPCPVTNKEFTSALASKLNRWAILPAPKFALNLALGQMAQELLLASTRAVSDRLEKESFPFRGKSLERALDLLLP